MPLFRRRPRAQPIYSMDDIRLLIGKQDLTLRRIFAAFGLLTMTAQLVVASLVFLKYAEAQDWRIPEAVMGSYLGATVVQVVSIVLVMTRSLFPAHE